MTKDTFFYNMKHINAIHIGNYILFKKPCSLFDTRDESENQYANLDEAYENAVLDGRHLKEIIDESDDSLFTFTLDDSGLIISE